MTFLLAETCFQLGLRVRAVVFRDLRIAPAPAELRAEIDHEIQQVRNRFASPAAVRSCAEVAAFHQLHRRAVVPPRKEQSSVERLLLLALKRGELPAINNLVDAYNPRVAANTLLAGSARSRRHRLAGEPAFADGPRIVHPAGRDNARGRRSRRVRLRGRGGTSALPSRRAPGRVQQSDGTHPQRAADRRGER